MSRITSNCQGLSRRDFIQLGLGGTLGLGLADGLRLRAARDSKQSSANDTRCILVWLDGGPSHYETFDPKPEAPQDIRGDFSTLRTSVPGVHFSEAVPQLAKVMDKVSIIRSICHKDPNHGGGNHYMMTGAPTPVPVSCGAFVTFHPSFGSMVSHERGIRQGLPAYMSLPRVSRSGGPNFLGDNMRLSWSMETPIGEHFRVRDVVLPASISEARAEKRRQLRASLDNMRRIQDAMAEDPAISFDEFYEQVPQLVTSPEAQRAFQISDEPEKIRDRYGRNDLGQRLLMARRLTEVGVSFVTVYYGGWDNHTNLFKAYKGSFMSKLDQGLAALIRDLHERGSAEKTMVICLGEFGRTPKVNKDAGRDHWPHAMSVLMSGAGIPGGQIIGATDARGFYASDNVYSPEDFAVSLYEKMGIDPHQTLYQSSGRPVRLVNGGKRIRELFA